MTKMTIKTNNQIKPGIQLSYQLLYLCAMAFVMGFTIGTYLFGVTFAPMSVDEFVSICDRVNGVGEWKVVNNTCSPISYMTFPEDSNITLPVRGGLNK